MIVFVSVSMFDHKPERCPFGHSLWPGMAQVGWQPCICTAAQEAAERAVSGMGTSGCHVTPATTNSGKRRSTSRRTMSTIWMSVNVTSSSSWRQRPPWRLERSPETETGGPRATPPAR